MKIHFVTSEALPYSKTGGLADVVYGLGKALAQNGHEVIIISPLYRGIYSDKLEHIAALPVDLSWRHRTADIYRTQNSGITYYFISDLYYFDRGSLYGFDDDIERFAFFQLSYIQMVKRLNLYPDIVHVHDWEAAMIPLLLRVNSAPVKTILTIHNPAFQGNTHPSMLSDLFNLDPLYYENGTCRFHDFFSCLKTGIVTATKVTTVSKRHAYELLDDKISYNELGRIIELRKDDFIGIVNGVDYDEYNPQTDHIIAQQFAVTNYEEGKKVCKDNLESVFNLSSVRGPSLGIISRLTEQKGLDIIPIVLPLIIKCDMRLYVLGNGEYRFQNMLKNYADTYPNNIIYYEGYSVPLAHKIYAGVDFFFMPSRYEPCGIGQLIAKAYGTIPIVSAAGGLYDTVIPFNGNNLAKAEGFRFNYEKTPELLRIFNTIAKLYREHKLDPLIVNAMKADSSWPAIAPEYEKLYQN